MGRQHVVQYDVVVTRAAPLTVAMNIQKRYQIRGLVLCLQMITEAVYERYEKYVYEWKRNMDGANCGKR